MALEYLPDTDLSSKPLLCARGLFCERDDRVLFEHLSFDLCPGEIVRLAGPNGAGKSSLMRILLGLSASYEGSLYWREQDMARSLFDFRSELLYIGHDVGVKSNLTPEENLAWACPNVTKQDIYVALKRVGLMGYEDLLTHGLSAGQQRRVALARLFLSSKDLENKPLWILDEPFTAIDKAGVADLEQVIVDHAQQGGLVILTTHHDLSVPVKTIMMGQTQKATL